MTFPQHARYTPIKGRGLTYPVLVHASRKSFGRQDYEISTERDADSRIWVTAGPTGQQLQFEEDLTTAPGKE